MICTENGKIIFWDHKYTETFHFFLCNSVASFKDSAEIFANAFNSISVLLLIYSSTWTRDSLDLNPKEASEDTLVL